MGLEFCENFKGGLFEGDFFDVQGVNWFGCVVLTAKGDSPFVFILRYGSQSYSNAIFKAYQYRNVQVT